MTRVCLRDLGISIGTLPTGARNAIIDPNEEHTTKAGVSRCYLLQSGV